MSIATEQEPKRSGRRGLDKAPPASDPVVPGESITPPPRLRRRPALVAASVAAIEATTSAGRRRSLGGGVMLSPGTGTSLAGGVLSLP